MQNYFVVLLALTSNIFANPIESSLNDLIPRDGEESTISRNADEKISPLEFFGPITPNGPEIKLTGDTAKDIYEQILKLNPSYDVFDFPTSAAELKAAGVTRENIAAGGASVSANTAVTARNALERRDSFNCGVRSDTLYINCVEGLNYLRALGGWCGAGAKSCSRVSCSSNCGMWLCSKMNKQKRVRCASIAKDIAKVAKKCASGYGIWTTVGGRIQFASHNVEVGSASC